MRSFECLITDSRFSVRQLTWFIVEDEARACELAQRKLLENRNHQRVEVREQGRVILVAQRDGASDLGRPGP